MRSILFTILSFFIYRTSVKLQGSAGCGVHLTPPAVSLRHNRRRASCGVSGVALIFEKPVSGFPLIFQKAAKKPALYPLMSV
jgi:hypothetical protein